MTRLPFLAAIPLTRSQNGPGLEIAGYYWMNDQPRIISHKETSKNTYFCATTFHRSSQTILIFRRTWWKNTFFVVSSTRSDPSYQPCSTVSSTKFILCLAL